MKNNQVTKSMAVRNVRPCNKAIDPFRQRSSCQARFNVPECQKMPRSSQIRYPILFALIVSVFALSVLNFAMTM